MTRPWVLYAINLTFLFGLSAPAALAADGCCQCGNDCGVRKVCRLVCEEKKVEEVCYTCECEDYCLPPPSHRGCLHEDHVCVDQDCESCERSPRCKIEWFDWTPKGCAKLRTRNKLVKYVVEKKVPTYKWVVEDLCDGCCQRAMNDAAQAFPAWDAGTASVVAFDHASPPDVSADATSPHQRRTFVGAVFGK